MRFLVLVGGVCLLAVATGLGQTSSGTWQELPGLPTARQEVAAAELKGKIYVLGGLDQFATPSAVAEVFNPAANSWATAAPLPFGNDHLATAVAAEKLYVFGGLSRNTYVYDPVANTWNFVAQMLTSHGGTPAVGVIDNKIYCAGGVDGASSSGVLEVFDPATNTWTQRASMSVARNHTTGGVIDGKFYVVGGRGSAGSDSALEVYDPANNSWTSRAPMPTARSGIAAAVVGGELIVFGGEGSRMFGEVEAYNPLTNSWRSLPQMPTPRHGIWAAVIGNRVFLAGGGIDVGVAASDTNEVFVLDRKVTFANASARLKVETGDNVLIGGFIITGRGDKRVIIRGTGSSTNLPGALADPVLKLYDGQGQLLTTNDNWNDAPNRQEIIDSALAPMHAAEAAILRKLAPGAYTGILRGANNTTGIGLVEVFDLESGSEAQPANISARALVQTGDNVLIGGMILLGTTPRRVVLRAIGPSLPVPGALQDPRLRLHGAQGELLATNDNWRSTQEGEIQNSGLAPANDLESAIVQSLPPGTYTAIVRGADDATGIGLVEAYILD